MNNAELHCLSIDCPERKSICCGAGCYLDGVEFRCKNCQNLFVGGKCNAYEKVDHAKEIDDAAKYVDEHFGRAIERLD